MYDRPGLFRAGGAVLEPESTGRSIEQGQTRHQQGRLSAETVGVEHHGPGSPGGCHKREQLTGCCRIAETAPETGQVEGTRPLNLHRPQVVIGLRLGRDRRNFGPLRQSSAAAGYQRPLGFEGDQ